jgi:predicted O-methyltransferase YrrM
MNAAVFENWFSDILPRLEEDAVVVMDNASYQSRKLENIPNTGTKKADIQD